MKKLYALFVLVLSVCFVTACSSGNAGGAKLASPTHLSVTAGDSELVVSWASVDGATSYNIYYDSSPGVTRAGNKIPNAGSPYRDAGLTNGSVYCYVVTSENDDESDPSAEVCGTPRRHVPGVPQNVSASGGNRSATIQWEAVPGAASYNVYWSNSAGVDKENGTRISGAISPYSHTGLTNEMPYYYIVTAVKHNTRESAESAEVSVTPQDVADPDTGNDEDDPDDANSGTYPSSPGDHVSIGGVAAFAPSVASDDSGNSIIAWNQPYGYYYQVYLSEYRNGQWHHPAGLEDHISIYGLQAQNPKVAMDNNGNAIVVWVGSGNIYKSEYRDGVWTHPRDENDHINPFSNSAVCQQVAMDDEGNAIIVWWQSDGTNYQIYLSQYRNGAWRHPAGLQDHVSLAGRDAGQWPRVVMSKGDAIIVWSQNDGTNYQIYKSEYRSGAWTHPAGITDRESAAGTNAWGPAVAMDNNGNAIIAWGQSDGSAQRLYKREYRNGSWSAVPSLATDAFSPGSSWAYDPSVAMDDNGNALIVWHQTDYINYRIFKSEYRNGSWHHPAGLSDHISPDGQNDYYAQVAMDSRGNSIIMWWEFQGSDFYPYITRYQNETWSAPLNLAGLTSQGPAGGGFPNDSAIAMNHTGAIVVWQQFDDHDMTQIYKAQFK